MDWLKYAFSWYFIIFVLGVIFFPLTKKVFSSFVDKGYAFSKTIAILLISYFVFLLGSLKIPILEANSIIYLFGFLVLGFLIFIKNPFKIEKGALKFIIIEEVLFILSYLFLTYIRGQNPDIHGLEKFMDFGIINSILRSNSLPPLDIWLTPHTINYYYFGHLVTAVLIKITNIKAAIGYNLMLSTILALSITSTFSICINLINNFKKIKNFALIIYGILGALILNFGGNLHTIYLFTSGYPNENPIPFWKIVSSFTPEKYWYPNATRFIPFTIHEFPSYSYTVADLHGHVLDIPFVLLTISLAFLMVRFISKNLNLKKYIFYLISAGFMVAILYMTNAFDGPIYFILFTSIILLIFKFSQKFFINLGIILISAFIFAYPFTSKFNAFVSGIGLNCAPKFLINIKKLGPFLFENGNCQITPAWMLLVLWGFFVVNFIIFLFIKSSDKTKNKSDDISLLFMVISLIFILIPEFFYVKDIYPAHFRANTMFKLGYQVFIMMSIVSLYVFFRINDLKKFKILFKSIYLFLLFFILIYSFFSFSSFYSNTGRIELDGSGWLTNERKADYEIIRYLNQHVKDQPVILEAQGDSYTDFARISSFTGLPTIAGWWVHEWLWRGSPDFVGKRITEIKSIYESSDILETKNLLYKYKVEYIIVSNLEREKYKNINESKFESNWIKIFESSDKIGAIYRPKF